MGMARWLRTLVIAATMAVTVIAALPAVSASADVGGLLGGLLGGGSQPPAPTPPPTTTPQPGAPQPNPLASGAASPAAPSGGQEKDPLLAPESSCPGQSDPGLPLPAQRRAMGCVLSFARVADGLPALHVFKPLQASAADKARDVRRCQKLSHDACGRKPWYWAARVGFLKGRWTFGEVLAFGGGQNGTVRGTMRRWLASKEHRAVILHPGFDLVGAGTVTGTFHGFRDTTIWVAHLGHRR
jgi:uncharacterized protein YkwD